MFTIDQPKKVTSLLWGSPSLDCPGTYLFIRTRPKWWQKKTFTIRFEGDSISDTLTAGQAERLRGTYCVRLPDKLVNYGRKYCDDCPAKDC